MATIAASNTTPVATTQPVNIVVAGASANTVTGYSTSNYPSEPAIVYRIDLVKTGQKTLSSPLFTVGSAGAYTWPSVIIPTAGAWTINLVNTTVAGTDATATVTAS